MIYGRGMLATALMSHGMPEDANFFCKGVSNSRETNLSCYSRELRELDEILKTDDKPVYYFSSVAVDKLKDSSVYYAHKQRVENLLASSGRGRIIRLPQVIGRGGNKNNLLNYFIDTLRSGLPLKLNKFALRNFVKATDVAHVVSSLHHDPSLWNVNKGPVEVSSPFDFCPIEIASIIAQHFQVELCYTTFEHHEGVTYDPSNFTNVVFDYNNWQPSEYLLSVISDVNVSYSK